MMYNIININYINTHIFPSIFILSHTVEFVKSFFEIHSIILILSARLCRAHQNSERKGPCMPNYLTVFQSGMLSKAHEKYIARELLLLNDVTREYGITLSKKDCNEIAECRSELLKDTERIEVGAGAVTKIIELFCESGYINQQNFKDTVEGLLECFYTIKTETDDKVSDEVALRFLKYLFEVEAGGDVAKLYDSEAFDLFVERGRFNLPATQEDDE